GLSHRWQYGMSLNALPESLLYRGAAEPSLLGKVKNFDDGATRLNLIQMLIDAERFSAARQLIGDTERQFPETTGRCETLASIWNDRVGEKLLEEIAAIRDSGRPVLATHYAREYPDAELAPVLRVRARQFLEEHDTRLRRLNALRTGVHQLIGEIADDTQRTQATRIWADLAGEADLHTLADFAAWEVLWQDDTLPPESRVALAVTGRLLGANNAVDSFAAAEGLSRMRYLIHDYLSTTETETRQREQIIAEVRQQEGFTVERVAMLIQQLPPESPLLPKRDSITVPRVIPIEGDDATAGCDIVVPAEYSETRRYPLLIALPRAGGTAEETLQFWRQQTDRRGFLLAVPRLYEPQATEYDASAATHQRFRNLLRRLRAGLSVDDERIFIAGHEIGGEAAMDIAASQPNSFAGIISLSGLGRRHLQWTAHNTGRIPWYVVVGTRQPTYYERMELLLRQLFSRRGLSGRAEYCDVVFCRYEERGYESFAEELPDIFRWMKTLRRPPLPDYILAEAIRSTDRRWFWLELTEVENRFVSFDESGSFDRKPSGTTGTVDARVHGNFFRLPTLPGKGFLKLSPDLPEFDPSAEVVIRPPGGRTQTVQYAPSVSDLLEDFRQNGDRGRLCYMRIPIGD
ncbi:MAG: hypothetical protein KDA89_13460, partial [Planctomycetaceae bacterium]|nr:hypothetical protein [Planctomycetaceae bacterium]